MSTKNLLDLNIVDGPLASCTSLCESIRVRTFSTRPTAFGDFVGRSPWTTLQEWLRKWTERRPLNHMVTLRDPNHQGRSSIIKMAVQLWRLCKISRIYAIEEVLLDSDTWVCLTESKCLAGCVQVRGLRGVQEVLLRSGGPRKRGEIPAAYLCARKVGETRLV